MILKQALDFDSVRKNNSFNTVCRSCLQYNVLGTYCKNRGVTHHSCTTLALKWGGRLPRTKFTEFVVVNTHGGVQCTYCTRLSQ